MDRELLSVFLPEARGHLRALEAGDRDARVHAADALHGACALVGAPGLAELASSLVDAVRAGADAAEERAALGRALDGLEGADNAAARIEWDPEELRGLRAFFVDEAEEQLDGVRELLTGLRRAPDDQELLAALLRRLHTFKGSAGSVQLDLLSSRAHALEEQILARPGLEPLAPEELAGVAEDVERLAAEVAELRAELRGGDPEEAAERRRSDRRMAERRHEPDAQTIRVEVDRLDELMDATSELVMDRVRLERRLLELEAWLRELPSSPADAPAPLLRLLAGLPAWVRGAGEDLDVLRRTSAVVRERLRRVRVAPIGRLLERLEAPVREVARREGKRVAYELRGESTPVDKALMERIAEPLLHLLRNAVAHGIEAPDDRAARGKPREGTVTVTARYEGDAVELEVADDGRGVDAEAVRHALVRAGRLAPGAALEDEALHAALFAPGVSTRHVADEGAGRGIGLDAVRDAVQRLGGQVRVASRPGRGAAFTLRLPLPTAVQEAVLFKLGGHVYAVPASRVEETVQLDLADLRHDVEGGERIPVRGAGGTSVMPLLRLDAVLGLEPSIGRATRRSGLVLTHGPDAFVVSCDRVIGPREIVLRPLGPLFAGVPLYAGATISGAGKVQLILDVEQLAARVRGGALQPRPVGRGAFRVLLADDSRAIREAASLILTQAGYTVETAADGLEAWERLQDRPFDLLVTDLEMPGLGGHGLLERLRHAPELAGLPAIVLSSRAADPARERAVALGATAFLAKPLRRQPLLDAVSVALAARGGG